MNTTEGNLWLGTGFWRTGTRRISGPIRFGSNNRQYKEFVQKTLTIPEVESTDIVLRIAEDQEGYLLIERKRAFGQI